MQDWDAWIKDCAMLLHSAPDGTPIRDPAAEFAWMEKSVFVSSGAGFPDYVQFSVYELI